MRTARVLIPESARPIIGFPTIANSHLPPFPDTPSGCKEESKDHDKTGGTDDKVPMKPETGNTGKYVEHAGL
jgi:hypothetical protein